MNAQNPKNTIKKLVMLIGAASAGTLLAVPALIIIDSNSGRQVLAQVVPENTQQNPVVPNTNQQFLGNPAQTNPVVPNTNQQFLGNPAQTNPVVPNTNQQFLGNPVQPLPPLGTGTIIQFPNGAGTNSPNTQQSGM
jgi:hypothetical protein